MFIKLVDRLVKYLVQLLEDIHIEMREFFITCDTAIMDMNEDIKIRIISNVISYYHQDKQYTQGESLLQYFRQKRWSSMSFNLKYSLSYAVLLSNVG